MDHCGSPKPLIVNGAARAAPAEPEHAGQAGRLYRVSPDAVDCPLGDGLALFDARNGTSFSLNRTGALIWNAARQPVSLSALRAVLIAACRGAPDDIDADLRRIVDALEEQGLFILVSGEGGEADAVDN